MCCLFMESARKIKDKPQFFMQNIFLTSDIQGTDFSTVYLLDLFNIGHYMFQHVHGTYRNEQKQQLM